MNLINAIRKIFRHEYLSEDEPWKLSRILSYAAEVAKKDPDGHVPLAHEWLFDKAEMAKQLEDENKRMKEGLCKEGKRIIKAMGGALLVRDARERIAQLEERVRELEKADQAWDSVSAHLQERIVALEIRVAHREGRIQELEEIQDDAVNAYNQCGARPSNEHNDAFVVWAAAWQKLGQALGGS